MSNPRAELAEKILHDYIDKFQTHYLFIHYTPTVATAESIMKNGLKYHDQFFKTVQAIEPDATSLIYKLLLYQEYGEFVLVLGFSKNEINDLNTGNDKLWIGEVIDEKIAKVNPIQDSEQLNRHIPSKYVLGLYNVPKTS